MADSTRSRRAARALLLLALLLPAACASGGASGGADPVTAATEPGDPLERTNRDVFDFNLAVDDAVLRPVAVFYRDAVPAPVRTGLRNALNNLEEPRILANNLLQGRLLDAGHTFMRFFINSTAGVGGLIDVAGPSGIARRSGDFGQTLHVWGVGAGPYLMLPLLGPSNPRDATGLAADAALNPLTWLFPTAANIGLVAADGVATREANIENLDEIRNGSLDPYARLRSLWRQNRAAEIGADPAAAEIEVLDDPGN